MKTYSNFSYKRIIFTLLSLVLVLGCQNDDADLQTAKYSTNPNVFIDGFSGGLMYAAFAGTDIFAFQVDNKITYNNTKASMRFDVPNVNDPAGAYAGGAFFTAVGRDLSSYNVLTFWAKSSQAATVGVIGFGIDLGNNKYDTSLSDIKLSTTWKKYFIPIPDASKLKIEKGMFYISAGADQNGDGYSFWVDEVKFENLETIKYNGAAINNGLNTIETTFNGLTTKITGLASIFILPNGTLQSENASPNYFMFSSSNNAVATVNTQGVVTTVGPGTAIITASLNGVVAKGSLTIQSIGAFVPAPLPIRPASNVISIFSNSYTNVPVEFYNGYWQYQTTQSADFVVNGNSVLNYTNLNFVGIQFSKPTVNASNMTYLHLDLLVPGIGAFPSGSNIKIKLVDIGPNKVFGGGDDKEQLITYFSPTPLVSKGVWIPIDIPFSSLPILTSKANLAQIIFEGTNITDLFVDNIYFYRN